MSAPVHSASPSPGPSPVRYELLGKDADARAGILHTRHGEVPTPAFMPVGTQATVKALSAEEVASTGARMAIMNTYHLWLRPGEAVVRELGGLHEFSRFRGALVTDSGGFQAFSLAARNKLSEDGFAFSSHLDGKKLQLSPEEAMRVQAALGADVAMQLDVCAPGMSGRPELIAALERTTRWAHRCLAARDPEQAVFGIIQGGSEVDLRLRHAEELSALPFDGLALGGFSVGEPPEQMHRTLAQVAPRLDPSRIHYLMGVGTPRDLLIAIRHGVDLFDCVMPTRNARNGQAFVTGGRLVIRNQRFRLDRAVLDESCDCAACTGGYSRAYLRHLYMAGEILAHRLLSLHNLRYYARLVAGARTAILEGRYESYFDTKMRELGD
ncbi:MAG TPA: tRNA guanosine(34) transglycosylase Tgt [Polyangiaceae bacterium]|nr:tRNA guanosine(34) transglycosylase Tgt [Polyangiaceae bacterium]